MANQEQVEILKQGVAVWNAWRMENPDETIDLSFMERRSIVGILSSNISSFYNSTSDLEPFNLDHAWFMHTQLEGANLKNSSLRNAHFDDTGLKYVNLEGANLHGAYFVRTDIRNSDFSNANLSHAIFRETNAMGTTFNNANLTGIAIKDWQINGKTNFEGVICDYIFLEQDSKEEYSEEEDLNFNRNAPRLMPQPKSIERERCPLDVNQVFASGEFTKRFQIPQNIIEIAFSEGVPWRAFSQVFSDVNSQVINECDGELFLQEYKVLGDGFVTLKILYPDGADKGKIQESLEKATDKLHESEVERARLKSELSSKDTIIEAKDHVIQTFERLLSRPYIKQQEVPTRINIEDIESFNKIQTVDFEAVSHLLRSKGYLDIPEDTIQVGLEKILDVQDHKNDWGGEYNDLFTTNLVFDGTRMATAFLLKGNGLSVSTMEIKHCGKNGDQLIRLFESPAELFIVQYVGNISESVIKDIEGKVERNRAQGKQAYYCLINGSDTARLLYAYDLL